MSDPLLGDIIDRTPDAPTAEIAVPQDRRPKTLAECHIGDTVTITVEVTGAKKDKLWALLRAPEGTNPCYVPADWPCELVKRRNPR